MYLCELIVVSCHQLTCIINPIFYNFVMNCISQYNLCDKLQIRVKMLYLLTVVNVGNLTNNFHGRLLYSSETPVTTPNSKSVPISHTWLLYAGNRISQTDFDGVYIGNRLCHTTISRGQN